MQDPPGRGRGDVPTILDELDDGVAWETSVPVPGVPCRQARRGKANFAGFFESTAPRRITRFEPHTSFDGGDKVFVLINIEATFQGRSDAFPSNGHPWPFDAPGKVVKCGQVIDTVLMPRMARGA